MLKENPSIFGYAGILAEHIERLDNLVRESGSINPYKGYAPMDLDTANA